MDCLELGSRPELGSSKKISLDPPIKLLARQSFLLLPPDRFFASLPFSLTSAHCSMVRLTWKSIWSSFSFLMR
jgi:hypothetical protein